MTRRPQRLIRLAQQLANTLGLDIDQDADVMTEEDLRELLNAAIDYVETAEEYRQKQISQPNYTLPNIIGVGGGGGGSSQGTWIYPRTYTNSHSHGFNPNSSTSDQRFFASVNAS